jgi:hypothetical protein
MGLFPFLTLEFCRRGNAAIFYALLEPRVMVESSHHGTLIDQAACLRCGL